MTASLGANFLLVMHERKNQNAKFLSFVFELSGQQHSRCLSIHFFVLAVWQWLDKILSLTRQLKRKSPISHRRLARQPSIRVWMMLVLFLNVFDRTWYSMLTTCKKTKCKENLRGRFLRLNFEHSCDFAFILSCYSKLHSHETFCQLFMAFWPHSINWIIRIR